jgi:hypothetical protein
LFQILNSQPEYPSAVLRSFVRDECTVQFAAIAIDKKLDILLERIDIVAGLDFRS